MATSQAEPSLENTLQPHSSGVIACPTCTKKFDRRGQFNRHFKTHSRPYVCDRCGKGFSLRSDLDRHNTRHKGAISRFECKVGACQFSTTRKDNLLRHIRNFHEKQGARYQIKDKAYSKELFEKAVQHQAQQQEESILHAVAQTGNESMLLMLIRDQKDLERRVSQGKTLLHVVALNGFDGLVRHLLARGAKIEEKDENYNLPLHDAVLSGNLAVVRLLTNGATINHSNSQGYTPLRIAASKGHAHIVRYLHQNGAAIDWRADMHPCSMDLAVYGGHLDVARFLLKNTEVRRYGWLTRAAARGDNAMLQLLLENGFHGYSSRAPDRALTKAAMHYRYETMAFLIAKGAKLTFPCLSWDSLQGQVNRSAISINTESMQILLDAAVDLQSRHYFASIALVPAAAEGNESILKLLLDNGADVHAHHGGAQRAAIECGQIGALKILTDSGADPKKFDEIWYIAAELEAKGSTVLTFLMQSLVTPEERRHHLGIALHGAVRRRSMALVVRLLEQGADINARYAQRYQDPRVPFEGAILMGDEKIIFFLLQQGAALPDGDDAVHLTIVAAGTGLEETVKLFLDRGVHIDSEDRYGATPLIEAVQYGKSAMAEFLIDHGANINHNSQTRRTALEPAAFRGDEPLVKLLLDRGALLTGPGYGALRKAAANGHENIVKLLLSCGAEIDPPDEHEESALEAAAEMKRTSIVKLLLLNGADVKRIKHSWYREFVAMVISQGGG